MQNSNLFEPIDDACLIKNISVRLEGQRLIHLLTFFPSKASQWPVSMSQRGRLGQVSVMPIEHVKLSAWASAHNSLSLNAMIHLSMVYAKQ